MERAGSLSFICGVGGVWCGLVYVYGCFLWVSFLGGCHLYGNGRRRRLMGWTDGRVCMQVRFI